MTGKMSRDKGARGERELAEMLNKLIPGLLAERSARCGVNQAEDIMHNIPGVHIECKRVEKLNIEKAMKQAKEAAGRNKVPMVCHRRNRKPWMVTIPLRNLYQLCLIIASLAEEEDQAQIW